MPKTLKLGDPCSRTQGWAGEQRREGRTGKPGLGGQAFGGVWGECQTGGSESPPSCNQALGTLGWLEEGGPRTEGMGSQGLR